VSCSCWRLFSTALVTVALTVTAMVAGPAAAAVPGPPTSVTARAGDQLAEVTWNAPTPDDPTITGYVATASPADTPPVTVDSTARTAMVTGLTNGTAYSFTVAATNPDGPSPAQPRTPQPRSPPGPPATALTLAASPTSILQGGTVQLSGRLQQTNTAESIAGETLTLERRTKGGTSWTTLATVDHQRRHPRPQPASHTQAHTDYRLRHPATPFSAASTSPTPTTSP
jgi:Fibronectin type III domain